MVLIDTSIWIRFLAGKSPFVGSLNTLLDRQEVLAHELVYGELLIGDRRSRQALFAIYEKFVAAPTVTHREVVELVRARKLQGRGIGWIDAHLLASAIVARAQLWTADAHLAELADELNIGWK
jgi:hypothetical protein